MWLSSAVDVISITDESHSVDWKLYFMFSLGSLRYSDVYIHESGRCHTLSFFLTFLSFYLFMFSFYININILFEFKY